MKISYMKSYSHQENQIADNWMKFEKYLLQESRIAILKIQSFQFAMKTPEVGLHYQQETAKMVQKSLLTFVNNNFILNNEGYFIMPVQN